MASLVPELTRRRASRRVLPELPEAAPSPPPARGDALLADDWVS